MTIEEKNKDKAKEYAAKIKRDTNYSEADIHLEYAFLAGIESANDDLAKILEKFVIDLNLAKVIITCDEEVEEEEIRGITSEDINAFVRNYNK